MSETIIVKVSDILFQEHTREQKRYRKNKLAVRFEGGLPKNCCTQNPKWLWVCRAKFINIYSVGETPPLGKAVVKSEGWAMSYTRQEA